LLFGLAAVLPEGERGFDPGDLVEVLPF